ncbi:hypothetical protein BGX28_001752, partial [Mortierella sp. GBA30]
MEFQTLSVHVQWSVAALVARFKEGLSIQVKRGLTNVWNTLTRLADTQAKVLMAYQNQEHVKSMGQPPVSFRRPQPCHRPSVVTTPSASQDKSSDDMDLSNVRACTPILRRKNAAGPKAC